MNSLAVIDEICVGNKLANRSKLLQFEEFAKTQPQIDIPVKHYIHGGMYVREITIPKDTILTGQIYKFDHFDIMISGDITVSTDTGERKRFTGYNCFQGLSGKKRAGYAHEDTTWITVHPFTGASGDEIQEFVTAETFEDLDKFNALVNVADYKLMVGDMSISESDIKEQVENKLDMVDMPDDYNNVFIGDSGINRKGLFSSTKIQKEIVICPARIKDKRTIGGRYTNHALHPNAEMKIEGDSVFLYSLADINIGEEITVNYRDVLTMRNSKGDLCQE
tara:strand:- start:383 stop:1216 length:834 start_codon:yes stop_codon:yes gene_type:complete